MWRNDSDLIGNYWVGSLPNIKGTGGNPKSLTNTAEIGTLTGALYVYAQTSNDYGHTASGSSGRWSLGFDASRYNDIYSNDTHAVFPANVKMPYVIKY